MTGVKLQLHFPNLKRTFKTALSLKKDLKLITILIVARTKFGDLNYADLKKVGRTRSFI